MKAVDVEIEITQVPRYYTGVEDDLYIAGDFNDWTLRSSKYKFTKLPNGHYNIKLDLPIGYYEYRISRGTATTIEIGPSSNDTEIDMVKALNHRLLIYTNDPHKYEIEVADWDDTHGDHTVTGNVFMMNTYFPYPQFNTTKSIYIYLPPDYYTSNKTYSVIYLHDGIFNFDSHYYTEYGELKADEYMEARYAEGKEVSILVGISTTNRSMELTPYENHVPGMYPEVGGMADLYMDFVVHNLKPYIDEHYRTKPDRENTGLLGESLGGLITLYGGLKYQETFGKLGMFSATYVWNNSIFNFVEQNLPRYENTKLYFTVGTQEAGSYAGLYFNMSAEMLHIIDILKTHGHEKQIMYSIRNESHHYAFWNKEFPLGYSWLFS